MALRGKEPKKEKPGRLRLMMYSVAGVGKTMASIQMDKPYIIDTENGTAHYGELVRQAKGAVYQTDDIEEAYSEVRSLTTTKHDYRTLAIDSFTPLYEKKLDEGIDKVGDSYGKHIAYADRFAKRLFRLLSIVDMNVVVTSHAKTQWTPTGGAPVLTFDGWKKLDYLFDLVLELERRGKKRFALVRKTRLEQFPDLDSFEWSIDELKRRWGKEALEREAEQVALASVEAVASLTRKVAALNLPAETVEKWLKKADVETFAEMTEDQVAACIAYCDKRIAEAEGKESK
jgi:hypothetical protein